MSVDMELLLDSVRYVESRGDTSAVSPKGAKGPYQFMDETAAEYGVKNPFNETEAREGARRYLTKLIDQFGGVEKALVAYNGGPGRLARRGSISAMPEESRNYLTQVMTHYTQSVLNSGESQFDNQAKRPMDIDSLLAPGPAGTRAQAAGLFNNKHEDDVLRASVLDPKPVDKASRIFQMQLRTGLPVGVIERNLDEIEQRAKHEDFDAETFRRESPLLAEWLTQNPTRAALAQGDYETLSALEQSWATLQAIPHGYGQGGQEERLMELGYKAVSGEITPQEQIERTRLKREVQELSEQFEDGAPEWTKEAAKMLGMNVSMLGKSAERGIKWGAPTGAALGAGLGMLGGPGAPLTVPAGAAAGAAKGMLFVGGADYIQRIYHMSVGDAYDTLEDAKDVNGNSIDPVAARYAALLVAVPNSLLETASLRVGIKAIPGVDKLIGKFTADQMKKILVRPSVMAAMGDFSKKYAVAVGTESFTEGMQEFLAIVSREITTGDMGEGFGEQDKEAIGTAMSKAAKGSAVLLIATSGPKVIEIYADMEKAEQNEQFMRSLGDIAVNSETFKNSPKAFGEYVKHLSETGSVKNVFIPIEQWNLLFQDGAPNAAQEVFGDTKQYAEAQATGGDLVIPIETYAEKLAGTQFHEKLIPNIRLNPGEMTPTEAAQAQESEPLIVAGLQREVAELEAKAAPLAEVYKDVHSKLRQIGIGEQEATRDATLTVARLRTRAERLGIDPMQLYSEKPLIVQRELPADMAEKLVTYNQQLAEPAVPFATKMPLEGGEINLPPATAEETASAQTVFDAATASQEEFGVFGGTVHPTKGNLSGTEGVAVAGYPQRGVVTEGAPTPQELETFMRRNRDIFQADPNAALGVWVDSESGKGYIDITNVLPRDMAIAQGEMLGEKAVWDLGAFEEIRLPTQGDSGQGMLFQPAYHGTHTKFDKFTVSKIGTGEGAQAFGWGLYFSSKKAIAESYREVLIQGKNSPFLRVTVNGQTLRDYLKEYIYNNPKINKVAAVKAGSALGKVMEGGTLDEAIANAKTDLAKSLHYDSDDKVAKLRADTVAILEDFKKQDVQFSDPEKGQLYKVDIPADEEFLQWDAPLSKQSDFIKQAIGHLWPGGSALVGRFVYDGQVSQHGSPEAASKALSDLGVAGIRYLDGGSRGTGKGTYNYVVFNDEAVEILETYYQGERGASVPIKNLITLLQGADQSTFLHESGHVWLEELRADAMRPDAPEQLKADWETIKDWSGAKDDAISKDAHEMFARGVEAYIMEGKAPAFALRQIFAQFKNWLTEIYKSMSMLDVKLTPEVVDVMDRLIASDEAIKQARSYNEFDIKLLDETTMSEAEYAAYSQLGEEAKLIAEDNFRAKVMKELKREKLQAWRDEKKALEPKVREEILEIPIYRAAYWLWSGALPDGSKVEGMAATKLDKQTLLDMGVTLTDLPFRYMENGLHPDVVAKIFGLPSGESLVSDLIGLPTLKKAIDDEVSRRIREKHGGIIVEGTSAEEVAMEVQNTQQIDVFNMELRILKRLGAKREITHGAILKDIARQIISRKKLKDLDRRVYEEAALRAGQEAQEAMLGHEFRMGTGRNLDKAFDAVQKRMLNLFLAKEANEKRMKADKAIKKWKKFLSRSDVKLAKTYNMDMVNAARAIASIHGIGSASDMPATYLKNLATYDPDTYRDMKHIIDMASGDGRPVEELTVDEFQIMKDAIDGLWHQALHSMQTELDGKRMDRAEVVGMLNARIAEVTHNKKNKAGYHKAVTKWEETKMAMLGGLAKLRRVEHWVDAVDGASFNGIFRRALWKPISQSSDRFIEGRRVTLTKYLEATRAFPKESARVGEIDAPELNGYVFKNKAELLGALRHTGTMSSLRKLLLDEKRGWGSLNQQGELDTRNWDAFITRMQDTGVLTKADYDFVQVIWDLFKELKPDAWRVHKEVYGFFPNEIAERPITTPFGVYAGGYYPAKVDLRIIEDAAIRAEVEAFENQSSSFIFPSPDTGFTKNRNEEYAASLSFEIGSVTHDLETVLKFIHMKKASLDVGRIITDKNFRDHLRNLDSEVGAVMLMPWIQRSAQQVVEQPSGPRARHFDKFFHGMRRGTAMQVMAFNVNVALQNVTGLALAAVKVKPRYLAGALWRYISSPSTYVELIERSSLLMKNRNTTQLIEMNREIDNILFDPNVYQTAKNWADQHAYFLNIATQHILDKVVWGGAYEQATRQGMDENTAVEFADSVVRETQGSYRAEDISAIEAGTAMQRAFTMFYGWFNMAFNLNATEATKALRLNGFHAGGRLLAVYFFGFMLPNVLAEAITQAFKGELFDDDDDDGYLDNTLSVFFGGQVKTATAMIPFFGQLAQLGINQFNDKWYDDRLSVSPIVTALEASIRAPVGIYKLTAEDDVRVARPAKDILTLIGMITGLPAAPIAKPLGYLSDIEQGEIDEPDNPVEFIRGLLSGRAPK